MSNPIGRPGITYAEVAAVADAAAARGERPTAQSVRGELGSGSLGTIQKHLTTWKAKHQPPKIEAVGLPPELQRALLAHIERATADARAELGAELAATQNERDTLADELERQAALLTAAEERGREQAGEIERHAGVIATLERALAEAREQIAREREAAEEARKGEALANLRTESLPQLTAELAAVRGKLDEEREARRVAEIEAAELRGRHEKKG